MSVIYLDVECFKNYWGCAFLRDDGRRVMVSMTPTRPLDIEKLRAIVYSGATFVGFNSMHYDWPQVAAALAGRDNAALKALSDKIIGGNVKSWQHSDLRMPDVDHIDIMETAPGVQIGLKLYGGRLHAKTLQDLPFKPDDVLTDAQIDELEAYNWNDVEITRLLHSTLRSNLALRVEIGAKIGVDLRSKSDAQMGTAIVRVAVEKELGARVPKPVSRAGDVFAYQPPAWLSFTDPMLQQVLRDVCDAEFVVKADGAVQLPPPMKRVVKFDGGAYRMGIGGLHSSEKRQHVAATADTLLIDRDVAGYYPSLIIQNGLSPEATGGHFQMVYRDLVARRLAAKRQIEVIDAEIAEIERALTSEHETTRLRARLEELKATKRKVKTEADGLKVSANACFGVLGSRFSFLYAPELLIQVTVTGQLALLMLIERITAAGARVVSANTDGLVFQCPADRQDAVNAAIAEWERVTGLETEATRYTDVWSRDVNAYIARKLDGRFKLKGPYANRSVDAVDHMHNPDAEIVTDAALAWLADGTPIEHTIRSCRDIRKFVTVRRVTGGAVLDGKPVGKVTRWYHAVGCVEPLRYITTNNKVPSSDGARPVLTLPDEFPDDVRYGHYVNETLKLLHDIGAT